MFWKILIYVLLGFVLAQIATLVTTIYLHRGSTHRAVKYHPCVEFCFQSVLWLTTGIKRLFWVAVHRVHHHYTDKDGDPHSPILLGFWKVQLGNVLLYRDAGRRPEVLQHAKDIKLSWAEKYLFRYSWLGLVLGIFLACLIFGAWQGLVVSLSHTVFYLQLNSLVNAYCHVRGYKNFPNAHAFNSHWVAWITGGEGNHNNHHNQPGSAKLSFTTDEPDFGWRCITFLRKCGLATVL